MEEKNKRVWKFVRIYEKGRKIIVRDYMVSNDGKLKSTIEKNHRWKKGRLYSLQENEYGYLRICIHVEGRNRICRVHRLVWQAFNGKIKKMEQIHHKDGNKKNNHIYNLEKMTHSEHSRMENLGRKKSKEARRKMRKAKIGKYLGEKSPSSIFTSKEEDIILNEYLSRKNNQYHLADKYGVSQSCICNCIRRAKQRRIK